jgi:AAA+ ATPase superfamily predicted ATPase
MHKIFQNSEEPLFGRSDNIIKLSPFDTDTLKTIISDYHPDFQNDDLLALYCFTGGIPKYLEIICDGCELKVDPMIEFIVRENSPFTDEGKNLLIEEFGKNYGTYFSILSAVSGGINTQPEIMAALGDKSIGGQIKRLIEDYNVLKRLRPIGSKEGTQTVRYAIADNFLQFWFNYFDRHRAMIEIKNFTALQNIIKADYTTYSGKILERYFCTKLAESGLYREIGSWWEAKGNLNEIDIVALLLEKNKALAFEVKRQKERYRPTLFAEKVERLKQIVLPNYEIESCCLSLEDM